MDWGIQLTSFWLKNVTSRTGGSNCPFKCLDSETFSPPNMFKFLLCFCCGFHSRIVTYLFHINCNVSCQKVLETNWQRYENSPVYHWRGPNLPSWHSLRKWSFFVTLFVTHGGVPSDLQDAAWESDHLPLHFFVTHGGSQSTSRIRLEKVINLLHFFVTQGGSQLTL